MSQQKSYVFTSESVSEGHPDKLADQISDAILDVILENDPKGRVAAETFCANQTVVLGGEISSSYIPDYEKIVRQVIKDVGYDNDETGIDYRTVEIVNRINAQSEDIKIGVDSAFDDELEIGAGDQGHVFGYATDETPELLPQAIQLSHDLLKRHAFLRKNKILNWLQPDAKSQVTLKYENDKPVAIDTIVLSTQHTDLVSYNELKDAVIEEIIKPTLPDYLDKSNIKYLINPTGRFVIGGPKGDCGLTGRKIIVDTYGGAAPHGGGAFSGKDPTKVDRSAAYAARHIAKNIVANGLASKCLIQVSYAIGVAKPTSLFINTFNTEKISINDIYDFVLKSFDLRPRGIIKSLDLLRPIYRQTAAYGHFGRNELSLPWEQVQRFK